MKIKKKFKLNEKITNNKEKKKIIDKIINSILPKKKIEILTENQKEKLLSAISCNFKTEEESELDDDYKLGFDDMETFRYKSDISENNVINKTHKISFDFDNLFGNDEINRPIKCSLGKKRKLSKTFDFKEYKKEESHKPSFDLTFNKNNEKDNNNLDDMSEINNLRIYDNYNNNKNGYNNEHLIKCFMNKNSANNNNQNINDNKNNLIINNVINVTNNIINNQFVYNIYNSETNNNNNLNQDLNLYEKNYFIDNEKNQMFFEKHFFNENQYNKCSNCLNNYKINYNESNEVDPFQLNFNNISSINDFENERKITVLGDDLFS